MKIVGADSNVRGGVESKLGGGRWNPLETMFFEKTIHSIVLRSIKL